MNKINEYDSETVQSFFDNYYHDRGKMKWQGFYLSDHTAALHRQTKKLENQNQARSEQSAQEITKFLMQSFTYNQIVKVQLNIYDTDHKLQDDFIGEVSGYDDDLFYLDNGKKFRLGEVRNVEIVA